LFIGSSLSWVFLVCFVSPGPRQVSIRSFHHRALLHTNHLRLAPDTGKYRCDAKGGRLTVFTSAARMGCVTPFVATPSRQTDPAPRAVSGRGRARITALPNGPIAALPAVGSRRHRVDAPEPSADLPERRVNQAIRALRRGCIKHLAVAPAGAVWIGQQG